ncbi:hypothetical protein SAMN02910357_02450 [Succinivibrio dextrinosolvens]|uniref:hypothetical protein n=1 Tax=Succinivibrio dextrinosolvens TaxID=83771 RepID=UPI0008EDC809|nr:hypothetical protein [Succinivibrio dextrinosolvens]SFS89638.1 hypothetical protein SAMN02910357_02450 [Succinivibrio dextrinosolvens]
MRPWNKELLLIAIGLMAGGCYAADDFNDVKGVPFIKGTVITCKASDFKETVFEGNKNYSKCTLNTKEILEKHKIKNVQVLTEYPAVLWGCFSMNDFGGVPIVNNENGHYSDYNRSVNYDGNCAVIIRVNYQHGGKCYPHFNGDAYEVFQSNHLSKVIEDPDSKKNKIEFVPCRMNDVQVLFEYE